MPTQTHKAKLLGKSEWSPWVRLIQILWDHFNIFNRLINAPAIIYMENNSAIYSSRGM